MPRPAVLPLLAALAAAPAPCGAVSAETERRGEEDPVKKEGKPNRLIHEKSPYLLDHAHNPVGWYPWGEEAFERARREGKPIFLSIGYSTCHWCHVMERESFENEEIAAYLNEHFVAIKVDREERPDVDAIYMEAVQAMTGHGGWPLSAFLTPEGKPFFAGTYLPPESFLELCRQVVRAWKEKRDDLSQYGERLAEHLRQQAAVSAGKGDLEPRLLDEAYAWYPRVHDRTHGGFGQAPKFPRTSTMDFLLRYAHRTGREEAAEMVFTTLDHMIRGGIHDHLGGGFHRYSTDRYWLVPHFEKMLYDQALIAKTLLDAYRFSQRQRYLRAARGTLDYVLRRLQGAEGGFYSAEDADTEGEEGKTYVWRREEILEVLGEERGRIFADYYGVTAAGNFEGGPASVLHVKLEGGEAALAARLGRPPEEVSEELAEDRARLLAVREKRPQPFLDDKVLADWNGLMLSAMAQAHQVTGDDRYLQAARRAAGFVLERLVKDGQLYRRYRAGEVRVPAFLEDHAFLIEGLLDLYEASFERRWLEEAVRLGGRMVALFWDPKEGGFFSTAPHHEVLIARRKEFYDGAVPSGNSVAFHDLVRLEELTGRGEFGGTRKRLEEVAAALVARASHLHPRLLGVLEDLVAGPLEIVLVGPLEDPRLESMLREVRGRFLPAKVVVQAADAAGAEALRELVPLMEGKLALGGAPTGYLCRGRVCKLPARDLGTWRRQLGEAGSRGPQ